MRKNGDGVLFARRPRSNEARGYPGLPFRDKNLFAPRYRLFLAHSLSKSSHDFGIRNRMGFCRRGMSLRFHGNSQVHDKCIRDSITFFFCDQAQFKSSRYAHAVNRCKRISASDRPAVIQSIYVHLPNRPIVSNRSLIAALALVRDCLSISMPTFRWPTCFETSFCTASGISRRTSSAAASAVASA